MRKLLPTLVRLIPLILGPAWFLIPSEANLALDYGRRFTYFTLVFILVEVVKTLVLRMYGRATNDAPPTSPERVGEYRKRPLVNRGREIVEVPTLIVAVLALAGILQVYKGSVPAAMFNLTLAAILLGSAEWRLKTLGWSLGAAAVCLISSTTVGYLSLFLSTGQWLWQTLAVSLTTGFLVTALALAESIEQHDEPSSKRRKLLSRLAIISTILGPAILGILVQFREIQPAYLLTFLSLPLLSSTLEELRTYEQNGAPPGRIAVNIAAANLLILVIVVGVSIVSLT